MSTLHLPFSSIRPALDVAIQAVASAQAMPDSFEIEIDETMSLALARAGWAPVICTCRRTVTVDVNGEERLLHEMSDADLQRWLLAEAEGQRWLAVAAGDEELFARAQAITVPLTAMALGITEAAAWEIPPVARRDIVHAQSALNEARLYGALKETLEAGHGE